MPIALVVLAGCSLVPTVSSVPTATDTATPNPSSSAEAPTELLPARAPLACADLYTLSAAAAAIGVPATDITLLPGPLGYSDAVNLQGGLLSCVWAQSLTDHNDAPQLSISILANAADDFRSYQSHHRYDASVAAELGIVQGAIGADSVFYCSHDEGVLFRSCLGSFESHGYWVHLSLVGPAPSGSGTNADPVVAIGEVIRDALIAAGEPVALYSLPSGSFATGSSCADIDAGSFATAVGSPLLRLQKFSSTATEDMSILRTAIKLSGQVWCSWTGDHTAATAAGDLYYLTLGILPGGEWAWPDVKASELSQPDSAIEELPGAQDAVIWCTAEQNGSSCWVTALVEHSVLRIAAHNDADRSEAAYDAAIRAMQALIERL